MGDGMRRPTQAPAWSRLWSCRALLGAWSSRPPLAGEVVAARYPGARLGPPGPALRRRAGALGEWPGGGVFQPLPPPASAASRCGHREHQPRSSPKPRDHADSAVHTVPSLPARARPMSGRLPLAGVWSCCATGWGACRCGLRCWQYGHTRRPMASCRHPASSARARMSASPSAAGSSYREMQAGISHQAVGRLIRSPSTARPVMATGPASGSAPRPSASLGWARPGACPGHLPSGGRVTQRGRGSVLACRGMVFAVTLASPNDPPRGHAAPLRG